MHKVVLPFVLAAGLVGTAAAAPAAKEMGAFDCSGSKPVAVTIDPGDHAFIWRGTCNGAEGMDIVVEPKQPDLAGTTDGGTNGKSITWKVTNKTKKPIKVSVHVFVGFA